MQIIRSKPYNQALKTILSFIAKDKFTASEKFKKNLDEQINNLINFPYKYRKSIYHESENIRDMTYKNYTIVYEIFENKIIIMTIFNQNKPKD